MNDKTAAATTCPNTDARRARRVGMGAGVAASVAAAVVLMLGGPAAHRDTANGWQVTGSDATAVALAYAQPSVAVVANGWQ